MASGPMAILQEDPLLVGGALAILAVFAIYKKYLQDEEGYDEMEPETMEERLKSIFTDPSYNQGARITDYVKMRGTSNTPRTIGLAVRAKDNTVSMMELREEDGEDKYEKKEVDGTTYQIIEGSKKRNILPKYWTLKTLPGTLLYDRYLESYDAPAENIAPGDDYIWFTPGTHFVKFNGVKRHLSEKGMGRVWGASFSKLHENYLEAKQAIPEQYATLNNRISGDIKLENIKSENIRKYMEEEEKRDKKNVMGD